MKSKRDKPGADPENVSDTGTLALLETARRKNKSNTILLLISFYHECCWLVFHSAKYPMQISTPITKMEYVLGYNVSERFLLDQMSDG